MKAWRLFFGLAVGLFALVTSSPAQSGCAPTLGSTTASLPAFSGTVNGVLATSAGGQYVYVLTQYGIARGSLANPASPGPFVLAQIGHKSIQGNDNGGKVPATPAICDCWQGGTTIDAAEAADGSARMISDFDSRFGGLTAEVATADASNNVAFGQQINTGSRVLGARVAALYLSSGKYVGYFTYSSGANVGGIAVVDLTTTTGSPSQSAALNPFGTLPWGSGSAVLLKAAYVAGKYLLVAGVNSEGKIRIAEVDSSTGVPTPKSSVSTTGTVNSLAVAAVNGRTFVFSAEGPAGIQIYEYVNGALIASSALTGGNFNEIVVTGGTFPLLFAHNIVSLIGRESYVEVFDTNWVSEGGLPRQAAHLRHTGAPENFIGKGFQAFVSGNKAYVYRIQPNSGAGESLVSATTLDISCISISPTSKPIVNSTAVNLSAAQRQGVERALNYYGDKWQIQDASASSTSPPANGLDQIEWDWNYATTFSPSTGWSALPYAGNSNVNPAYFPCEPSSGGNIRTGTGCATSLGISGSGPTKTYNYALQTHNGNGWGGYSISSPIQVFAPQAKIVGLDSSGPTPVLKVLTGQGVADASGSQGNLAEATFLWQFTPSGGGSAATVPVPGNATAFSLTISYKGGYTSKLTGNVVQTDLVPEFSPTSGSITVGGSLSITNKMQKSAAATVTSVEYAWDAGTYSSLASSFNAANGQATVPAPALGSNHTLKLRYNYMKSGAAQTPVTVSHGPFNVTNSLTVTVTGPPTGQTGRSVTFTAAAVGGTPPVTYTWCFDACSLGGGFAPGPATNSHLFTGKGTYTVVVKATDSGGSKGTGSTAIVISGGSPGPTPTPTPPPGGGNLAASLTGPGLGQPNTPVSPFTAIASGGTPPYTFAWRWGDNALSGYVSGPQTNSYTYVAAGSYNVSVRVNDSAGKSTTATKPIVISGPAGKPAPSAQFSVDSGATANPFNGQYNGEARKPIGLTAGETSASSYAWDFGDGTTGTGKSVAKSFDSIGSFTVRLTVTGDEATTSGTASSSKKFSIGAAQFSAVVVPDAASIVTADGAWKTDVTVTNSGATPLDITPHFESYEALAAQTSTIDVTTLGFTSATKYTLAPGGSWSQEDVVGFLGGSGKGSLFIKTEGGAVPDVAARVYFAPSDPELGSYGNAVPAFEIGAYGQVGVQSVRALSPQTLVGLRTDEKFRFKLKLYNSSGSRNAFRVTAFDEGGNAVPLKDDSGNRVPSLDFPVGAYQSAELGGDRIGLDDPTHRYVLKALPLTTGAMLLASASVIDRVTNDQVQLADDASRPTDEGGRVTSWVPAISRFDGGAAHWRTSVAILNSGSSSRDVLVEYTYAPGKVAQSTFTMESGKLLSFDDIAGIFPDVAEVTGSPSAGLLRVSYPSDAEASTNPVYTSARSYDDRSTTTGGTAGTALETYASADAIGPGDLPIVIPGAEQNERFRTNVGVFALDDTPTGVTLVALDKDGITVGSFGFVLNAAGNGPWVQFPVSQVPNLPTEAVSLRLIVGQGGRVGGYAITVDQKSLDTTFVKGTR